MDSVIEGLPLTIIGLIARILCKHCSSPGVGQNGGPFHNLPTLASLCRVNSKVGAIATPFLYHRPVCSDQAIMLLITTLKQRPGLLTHVRHLVLSSSGSLKLPEICLPVAAQCPNLEELDLNFQRYAPSVPYLARDTFLHSLRRLVVQRATQNVVRGLISWCPNLVSLELFEAPISATFPTLPRITDTLKELKLLHAVLQPGRLAELMKTLPNLESLSYIEGLPITDSPHDLLGSASQIKTELLSTVRHLRRLELSLDARKQRMNKPPRPTDDQLLGSLRDITALEELVLGAWYVTVPDGSTSFTDDMALVELLPASIRSVNLEVFGSEYTKSTINFWAVMNLAASAPGRFPNLRVIEFIFTGMTKEEIHTIKTAFEMRGIKFMATSMSS